MSKRRTDRLVRVCEALEDELPRAKRCLVALRRSGRDDIFNLHIALRRLQLELSKPFIAVLDWMVAHRA